jgi:hypothetical protein
MKNLFLLAAFALALFAGQDAVAQTPAVAKPWVAAWSFNTHG